MEKDLELKLKKKRIRLVVISILAIAVVATIILKLNIEYSDYGEPLKNEIAHAEECLKDIAIGNKADEYAQFTVDVFEQHIDEAKSIAKDKDISYDEKKEAYESFKEQYSRFKDGANSNVISSDEVRKLIDDREVCNKDESISSDKTISYVIDSGKLKKAVDINLKAGFEGPDFKAFTRFMENNKMQGQYVAFYQMGSFGGQITAKVPMYTEKIDSLYLYTLDKKTDTLKYINKAKVGDGYAQISISQGGEYLIATEKLNQDGLEEEQLGNEEDGLNDNQPGNSGNTQNPSVTPDNNKGGQDSADSDSKDGEKISVTIQILCDTVASDMSKLSNQDVAACIPDNGVILKKTTVKVKKNATVYDVLLQACRSNNIQTSAIYTPMYGSYYVEAINGLYEFDAGESSGWMFKVNNIFPTYGPSEVKVVEGDSIVWCYTCNLGPDVGNSQQKR